MSVAQFGIPALQDNGATAVVLNEEGQPALFTSTSIWTLSGRATGVAL